MENLLEKLKLYAASGMLPMHMPGHKRSAAFPWLAELGCAMDITEIDGFDNLNDPRGLFRDMERRAARLWGADESVLLVNGSTGGVLAAIYAALRPGGELLMARGCHKSVYHAAELLDATVHYLAPRPVPELGFWGSVTAEEVAAALDAHPAVGLVAVTSPTFEGVISDIAAVADVCHARGVPLFVDEAHGAHLGLGRFPAGAVSQGADLVVQSLHKTLPSLTQTAVLHVKSRLVEPLEVCRSAAIFQSSSPSYLLCASMDGCLAYLEQDGVRAAEGWLRALERFTRDVQDLHHLRVWVGDEGVFARDPSKLVLSAREAGLSGAQLMCTLRREHRIELEMATGLYALAMTGMGDTDDTLDRLARALRAVDGVCPGGSACAPLPFSLPRRALSIRQALSAPGGSLPLADAEGAVCGEYVWAYPPGAPLLVPGETVDEAAIAAIMTGVNVRSSRGGAPERIFCVREY